VLDESKWCVIKGWHVLRHSFISACAAKAIDQRFIDEWVGHCSEAMRRRYRHLYPSVQAAAINRVFGSRPHRDSIASVDQRAAPGAGRFKPATGKS